MSKQTAQTAETGKTCRIVDLIKKSQGEDDDEGAKKQ